jgi:hypothetical protein
MTDANVYVFGGTHCTAAIGVAADWVINSNPFDPFGGQTYPIAPGVMHDYRFVTPDMQAYVLYVDGVKAFSGGFTYEPLLDASRLTFGDLKAGLSSRSGWDYVRFGVIPEPTTGLLFAVVGCVAARRERLARTGRRCLSVERNRCNGDRL